MDALKNIEVTKAEDKFREPGLLRLQYTSAGDSKEDWALLSPGVRRDTWVVFLHGHGSAGDQLFTRPDIREHWLPEFRKAGVGVMSPNLRGNAWMSPQASFDMRGLLCFLRSEYKMGRAFFVSGSMGGTGNLVYGVLRPADVSGIVACAAASDIASYHAWCRRGRIEILHEIADAISSAYQGGPDTAAEVYRMHSVQVNAHRLTMPVACIHGNADEIIPPEQSRALAGILGGKNNFSYREINGGHDAPLFDREAFIQFRRMVD